MIEITVIDPVSRKKEVFKCDKVLLMSKMKFFELYNKEAIKTNASSQGIEDLDITIQCSILLFKFLIKYIQNPASVQSINCKNVHQILISADFLLMPELID